MPVDGQLAAGEISAEGDGVFGNAASDWVEAATVTVDNAAVSETLSAGSILPAWPKKEKQLRIIFEHPRTLVYRNAMARVVD